MALFGKKNSGNNEDNHTAPIDEQEQRPKNRVRDNSKGIGQFAGFVLLSENEWSKEKFLADLKADWGINIPLQEDEEKELLYADAEGFRIVVSLMPYPVPNGEAEHFAKANYMWRDAEKVVAGHKAQILVCILGDNPDIMAKGRLFVKIACCALKQEKALALYSEGAVYEPRMFIDCSRMIKDYTLPIMNLVWFGLYGDGKQAGVYTYGMRRFGREEIEVYVDANKADLEELRAFVLNIAVYVLDSGVTLRDGETIGFSAEQKLPITVSPGIAVSGNTVKITL